mmetsp:Transcript_70584/g.132084  ORF Transcript_70584/g.132084 Transcript_70584/m.132084 type:complete len:235 (-) Transcript_70584:593-1297(-)
MMVYCCLASAIMELHLNMPRSAIDSNGRRRCFVNATLSGTPFSGGAHATLVFWVEELALISQLAEAFALPMAANHQCFCSRCAALISPFCIAATQGCLLGFGIAWRYQAARRPGHSWHWRRRFCTGRGARLRLSLHMCLQCAMQRLAHVLEEWFANLLKLCQGSLLHLFIRIEHQRFQLLLLSRQILKSCFLDGQKHLVVRRLRLCLQRTQQRRGSRSGCVCIYRLTIVIFIVV